MRLGRPRPPALAGGASTVVDLAWTSGARLGEFEVTVTVDPSDTLPELDETDNARVARTVFTVPVVPGVRAL